MNLNRLSTKYQRSSEIDISDPISTLKNLELSGLLDNSYMVYEKENELTIAFGNRTEVIAQYPKVSFKRGSNVEEVITSDPIKTARDLFSGLETGTWVAYGYLAFDLVKYYFNYPKASVIPELYFFIPTTIIQAKGHKALVYSLGDIDYIVSCLRNNYSENDAAIAFNLRITDEDLGSYNDKVLAAKKRIIEKRMSKAIISRSVIVDGELDIISTYLLATKLNNSARSFALKAVGASAVGCSPEILLICENNKNIVTNPLAGTRARGTNQLDDEHLYNELFSNAKEVKEHALSIYIAQEEIRSVSKEDSVFVSDFLDVRKYRCVQHLSSKVGGQLREGYDMFDAIKAVFSGVTVSGIPKGEAIKAIGSLEQEPRGIYAGAIGWLDSAGSCDLALALRSAFQYGSQVYLTAGAGIVEESVPAFEYKESQNKMKTIADAIVMRS